MNSMLRACFFLGSLLAANLPSAFRCWPSTRKIQSTFETDAAGLVFIFVYSGRHLCRWKLGNSLLNTGVQTSSLKIQTIYVPLPGLRRLNHTMFREVHTQFV